MSDETPAERNNVLLIVVGVLVALSVVIAALVIFSSGEAPAEKPEAAAPVKAGEQHLTVGKDAAATKVVVYEDFADPASRGLEIASRDFLRIEAARGKVQVEYHPFAGSDGAYARDATGAWLAVLSSSTPRQALAFHDVLFDRQPEPGAPGEESFSAWAKTAGVDDAGISALGSPDPASVETANQVAVDAGVTRTPVVLVDAKPLTAASPTDLADKLQRLVLARD